MLPSSVKIGPYTYTVVEENNTWQAQTGVYGMMHSGDLTIHVNIETDPIVTLDTFLHECLHGIHDVMGIQDGDGEERVVTQFSTGMVMLLKDNPDILDYLYAVLVEDDDESTGEE